MIKLLPTGWSEEEKRKYKKINGKTTLCYFGVEEILPDDDFSSTTDTESEVGEFD
jgi:hypothetical protein